MQREDGPGLPGGFLSAITPSFRRVPVKGSGGVPAAVVVRVSRGKVRMSIEPPFTWEAVMDSAKIDELVRTLKSASEDARQMRDRP